MSLSIRRIICALMIVRCCRFAAAARAIAYIVVPVAFLYAVIATPIWVFLRTESQGVWFAITGATALVHALGALAAVLSAGGLWYWRARDRCAAIYFFFALIVMAISGVIQLVRHDWLVAVPGGIFVLLVVYGGLGAFSCISWASGSRLKSRATITHLILIGMGMCVGLVFYTIFILKVRPLQAVLAPGQPVRLRKVVDSSNLPQIWFCAKAGIPGHAFVVLIDSGFEGAGARTFLARGARPARSKFDANPRHDPVVITDEIEYELSERAKRGLPRALMMGEWIHTSALFIVPEAVFNNIKQEIPSPGIRPGADYFVGKEDCVSFVMRIAERLEPYGLKSPNRNLFTTSAPVTWVDALKKLNSAPP